MRYSPPLDGLWEYPLHDGRFGVDRGEGATTDRHIHRGIDIRAEQGRPLLALTKAVVEHAWTSPDHGFNGYGNVIVLRPLDARDSGFRALYAHCKRVYVRRGDIVLPAQPIGEVGITRYADGDPDSHTSASHLHFEIATHRYPIAERAVGDPRVDPIPWMVERGITDTVHGQEIYHMIERMIGIQSRAR